MRAYFHLREIPKAMGLCVLILGMLCSATARGTDIQLGQPFDVRLGEAAVLKTGKLTIRFDAVGKDSRCPKGATCVWAGNGSVHLSVSQAVLPPSTVTLNTLGGSRFPSRAHVFGYLLKLLDLKPYPTLARPQIRADFVATLIVEIDPG